MNKKVSKTLAAVLSAAMAASAFAMSTGATFAADNANSNTISASASKPSIGIVAAQKGPTQGVNLSTYYVNRKATVTFTVNGVSYPGGAITLTGSQGWTVAADSDATLLDTAALKNGYLRASNQAYDADSIRRVTIEHKAKLESYKVGTFATSSIDATAEDVTVQIEVVIYPKDSNAILEQGNYNEGDTPSNDVTASINQPVKFDTYHISGDDASGLANFKRGDPDIKSDYNYKVVNADGSVSKQFKIDDVGSTNNKYGFVQAQNPDSVQTATGTVVATVNDITPGSKQNDVIPAKITVDSTYKVMDKNSDDFRFEQGKTLSDDGYNVTDRNIVIAANAATDGDGITFGADTKVGTVTGNSYTGNITVSGTTKDISADNATVNVQDDNGKVGQTITTGNIDAKAINVTGTDTLSNVTRTYIGVNIGDITATNINVKAFDNDDNNHPQGKGLVKIGKITIKRDAQETGNSGLTLTAGKYVNTMELGAISGQAGPYAESPFGAQINVNQGTFKNLGDMTNIGKITIGTKSTTADVTVGTIDTGNYGSSVAGMVDKTKNASTLQVNANSDLTADKITTDYIISADGTGTGSITVPVNSVVIKNARKQQSATKDYLYVINAKAGDILYTTYNGVTRSIFENTASKVVGQAAANGAYNFVMQTVGFDGIRMTDKAVEVGEDPATLTLAALPDTAKLPDGVTVAWTATTDKAGKQTVKLTPSADGMSCQVEATGYTADNINGGNDVVVTATLMKDGKAYTGVAANTANANVTLTNKTAARPLTGISLNKTSTVMKPKETRQLTVSYAPEDTTDNKTVTWTSSDPAVATVDNKGLVTGVAYGKTTITAKVGDFTATCPVVVSTSGMVVKVTDLDGKVTECAPDGNTTVDIPQSTAYRVELTSDEAINEFSYNAGNGKVGGTNTISVWNGTAGTYEAYAAGKVGEQTGFYVNGDKLFNMQVVTRPFVSDTTMTANVAVGKSYTFRITLNDKNAKFTFSTANGDAVATSYKKATYPDANGDYYCTVTTKQAVGNVGVYCNIDGKNYKVFAVNTRA